MNIIQAIKAKEQKIRDKWAKDLSRAMYQLIERDGELWLTYDGVPVIPTSMLNKGAIESLEILRTIYYSKKKG